MLQMENIYDDICTENYLNENSDIDNSTDENTVEVELAIHNQHNQCPRLYMYIQANFERDENPFDYFIRTISLWKEP